MGTYAQTSAEINCKTAKKAKAVYKILKQMRKDRDKNGNFDFQELNQSGMCVFITHSSNRIQNLEWQMAEVWDKIKKYAQEMNCPFLSEADGPYFSND